jgi:hypothetical protein
MNKQEYRTPDLWLSAYLICHGMKLDHLLSDKENPGKAVFCLSGNKEIKEMVQEYRNNGEVPAVDYKKAILDLRSKMFLYLQKHQGKGNPGNNILPKSNKLPGRWGARH